MRAAERFVIISGLSGSGKSTAVKIFEDLGFYCVDNLPIALLPKFVDLSMLSDEVLHRVAMVVDIRERDFLRDFPGILSRLREAVSVELIFFEASMKVLARRFSETRRRHPLDGGGENLSECIERETRALSTTREMADRIVDTTELTIHDLKKMLANLYTTAGETRPISITLTSFGYKYGLPFDADTIFDVRFLPNPHFMERLRPLSGMDDSVRGYILSFKETRSFLGRIDDLLAYLIPLHIAEGRAYFHIGVGCTGGKHRSVTIVEELKRLLGERGYDAETNHRDIVKETR